MSAFIGIRTDIYEFVVRVRGGYERHLITTEYGLNATKGWRRFGPTKRRVERAAGRRPYTWKTQMRQTWSRA